MKKPVGHFIRIRRSAAWRALWLGLGITLGVWLFLTPSHPWIDKASLGGALAALMIYALSWDEERRHFRLPSGFPQFIMLAIPIGLLVLTITRTQWASPGQGDWIRWIWWLGSSLPYIDAVLRLRIRS